MKSNTIDLVFMIAWIFVAVGWLIAPFHLGVIGTGIVIGCWLWESIRDYRRSRDNYSPLT